MKKIVIALLLFSYFINSSYAGINNAAPITPADLGAYKWVLSEHPQKDEVAFFQAKLIKEQQNGEKFIVVYNLLCYSPYKVAKAIIFAYSPDKFLKHPVYTSTWHIKIFETITNIDANFKSCGSSTIDNSGEIEFKQKNGLMVKIEFKSSIIKITEAQKRYKGLPITKKFTAWRWTNTNAYMEK